MDFMINNTNYSGLEKAIEEFNLFLKDCHTRLGHGLTSSSASINFYENLS